jgi:thiosulfate dehydrogenase (quinone) large subunit
MKFLKDKRVNSILWTLIRIWLGYQFIKAGVEKIGQPVWVGSQAGVAISGFLKGALAKATGEHPAVQQWYASFIQNIALPNAKLFSYIIAFGEFLTGLGLILGVFTYVALFAGAFMNLNYLLAGTTSLNPNMLTLTFVLLYVGANSYYYGIDRFLMPLIKKCCQPKQEKKG